MTPGALLPTDGEQDLTPGTRAERAVSAVLAELDRGTGRGVVVDSPPGAGKSALVIRAAAGIAAAGDRVMVVAQTNEQVDDLTDRLAVWRPDLAIGRLSAQEYVIPARIARHDRVTVSNWVGDLAACAVVLGTAAKWAMIGGDSSWPWAVVDEAYQMRSDLLLRFAGRFGRALFVGDPGQLDPFSTVETQRWTGLTWDPMQSAVAVLLRHNPDLPVFRLPVSWRLSESAARVVADAFYPFGGFASGVGLGERRLEFATRALWASPVDEAVELAASSGWALYELPARHTLRTDAEAVAACVALARRVLQRGAVVVSERVPGGVPITADRIAVGTAHRDQARAKDGSAALSTLM